MNALLYNAPLYIIRADNKRRDRHNDISHLSLIPYNRVKTEKVEVAGPIQEKQA